MWRCYSYDEEKLIMGDILWRRNMHKMENITDILKNKELKKMRVIL